MCLCSRHDFWYMLFWFGFIDTRVLACACHLTSFYILVELLSDNPWTCMSRLRSLNVMNPPVELLCATVAWWISGRSSIALFFQLPLDRLSRSIFTAREHLFAFVLCISSYKSYFCASWRCNIVSRSVITMYLYYFIEMYITMCFRTLILACTDA